MQQDSMGHRPGEGLCSMSTTRFSHHNSDEWWNQIGLRYQGLVMTSLHEQRIEEAVLGVLREHPPVAFVGGNDSLPLSTMDLIVLIQAATKEAEQAGEEERQVSAEIRRAEGLAQVEAAFAMPGADLIIPEGRWAGLTKGEAFAWCWTLFQYEPHGFVHPGTQVRYEAMQQLEQGDLPTVFGYPERAKELKTRGLDPKQYRLHKEALGAATFDPADVRY